jgi:hypothetical protein
MYKCHYTYTQINRTYTTRSESCCKLWTSSGDGAYVGASVVKKKMIPLWWGRLVIGKATNVWGQKISRKSLYLLPNFIINL